VSAGISQLAEPNAAPVAGNASDHFRLHLWLWSGRRAVGDTLSSCWFAHASVRQSLRKKSRLVMGMLALLTLQKLTRYSSAHGISWP
jgi:hypothetical protein